VWSACLVLTRTDTTAFPLGERILDPSRLWCLQSGNGDVFVPSILSKSSNLIPKGRYSLHFASSAEGIALALLVITTLRPISDDGMRSSPGAGIWSLSRLMETYLFQLVSIQLPSMKDGYSHDAYLRDVAPVWSSGFRNGLLLFQCANLSWPLGCSSPLCSWEQIPQLFLSLVHWLSR